MDERDLEKCGDCMWIKYDKEGTCWEFCKGDISGMFDKK